MSWSSRINSLAVIYEFELTHLKECELFDLIQNLCEFELKLSILKSTH